MDRPMKAYGPTVHEVVLADLLAGLGLVLVAWATAAALAPQALLPAASVGGGLLAGATAACGLVLALAGAGLRQNRAALHLGLELLAAAGLVWAGWGAIEGRVVSIVAGLVLLGALALVVALRRRAVRARFKPRFFSPRGFETMVAIADTMIDGDGREAIGPVQVAIRTDHLLADIRSPVTADLRTVMVLVEWALPLLIGRPFAFTALGSQQRRRAVEKVIGARGAFRDVARSLKVLSCAGYYGDPATMRSVGYRPFDERARAAGVDQGTKLHPDPFERPEVGVP